MEAFTLTQSQLLDHEIDPRSQGWLADNLWHPFVNGTGVTQIYNNFAKEKIEPAYVPQSDTFSSRWVVHSLASAGGAVLTYALAGKAAGMGLGFAGSKLGLEGAAANILTNQTTAQIVGAGLYDFAKAPNAGETRLGNMAGSVAAFGVFSAGNYMLGSSKAIAESGLATTLGRIGVGAAGGLTSLETSHFVSSHLGAETNKLSWDDRFKAMANGGFINAALPPIQNTISKAVDAAVNAKPYRFATQTELSALADEHVLPSDTRAAFIQTDKAPGDLAAPNAKGAARSNAEDSLPKLILLKQQFKPEARQAQMERVAGELADFINGAKESLHIAIYDFRLKDPTVEKLVVDALNNRAEAGKDVKIAFFKPEEKSLVGDGVAAPKAYSAAEEPMPLEEPMEGTSHEFLAKLSSKIKTQALTPAETKAALDSIPDPLTDVLKAASPKETGTADKVIDVQKGDKGPLDSGVGTTGVTGAGKLMHNKYMVRDAGTKDAAIWTGSTNFTDDAFGSQDNNIIQIKSRSLADVYEKNFSQLWEKGSIQGTGKDLHTTVKVGDSTVTVAFSPGDGGFIDAEFARRISAAKNNVHIASMVISSKDILQSLSDKIDAGKNLSGIYDGPQMANIVRAWTKSTSDESAEKLALWNKVKGSLVAKNSHPYSPDGPHDFMHNKTVSIDDAVTLTGSFNLSMNATKNAENMLVIENPKTAIEYKNYIQDLVQTYGKAKK